MRARPLVNHSLTSPRSWCRLLLPICRELLLLIDEHEFLTALPSGFRRRVVIMADLTVRNLQDYDIRWLGARLFSMLLEGIFQGLAHHFLLNQVIRHFFPGV